jgi:uncharacterized protein involved in exopolysaccharide biosynthesis
VASPLNDRVPHDRRYLVLVPPADSPGVSVDRLLHLLRARWYWLLLGFVLGAGVAAAYAFTTPRYYRSSVVLAVDDGNDAFGSLPGQASGLAALAGIDIGGDSDRQKWLAILRSREVARTLIENGDLLPVLFAKRWLPEQQAWEGKPPSPNDAVKLFTEDVRSVEEDSKSGLVTVNVEWTDPALARNWAAELVALSNRSIRAEALTEAERNLRFLAEEARTEALDPLRSNIFRLVEANLNTRMLARLRSDYPFRVVDPPVVSDRDDPVRPKRRVIVALGALAGLFLAAALMLLLGRSKLLGEQTVVPAEGGST